jgi:GNAT superfamily N-acetyltransferase
MNYSLARTRGTQEEAEVNGPLHERSGQARVQGSRIETRVSIRDATPADGEALRGMFSRASSETIYLRFHTPYPAVPEWMVALMLDLDHPDKEFLLAVTDDEIVGHAMYVVLEDSSEAEMAIIVEDGWQSRGAGKSLLTGLAKSAGLRGIETFTAEVLLENRRMLGLAAAMFAGTRYTIRDGQYHVRMPLGTSEPAAHTSRALSRVA